MWDSVEETVQSDGWMALTFKGAAGNWSREMEVKTVATSDGSANAARAQPGRFADSAFWRVSPETGDPEYMIVLAVETAANSSSGLRQSDIGGSMTRVFTWYQLQEDEAEFFNFVEKLGDIAIIPFIRPIRPQDVKEVNICEFLERDYTGGEIVVRGALERFGVQAFGNSSRPIYGMPQHAETVSYDRVFPADGRLGASNMFADWVYPSEDRSAFLEKSAEFKQWATKLFNWARRHAPERLVYDGYPYPATRRAAEAFRRGEFELES